MFQIHSKRVCNMIKTQSMHHTTELSKHRKIIWPIWSNLRVMYINKRYSSLIRANVRYSKNGEKEIFLMEGGNFLNGQGEAVC